jgi:hypothetical protein
VQLDEILGTRNDETIDASALRIGRLASSRLRCRRSFVARIQYALGSAVTELLPI